MKTAMPKIRLLSRVLSVVTLGAVLVFSVPHLSRYLGPAASTAMGGGAGSRALFGLSGFTQLRLQASEAAATAAAPSSSRACPRLPTVSYPDPEDVVRHYPTPATHSRWPTPPAPQSLPPFSALSCNLLLSFLAPSAPPQPPFFSYSPPGLPSLPPDQAPPSLDFGRAECECHPVHFFAILSMQRSGSGWFETLLNNHPNVSSHGEVFSVRPRRQNFTTIRNTLDTVYSLDFASSAAKNTCTAAVGLKWMLNQGGIEGRWKRREEEGGRRREEGGAMEYNREVAAHFREHGVSVVMLLRRNVLRRLISILANAEDRRLRVLGGEHKSHVHSTEEAKRLAEFRPHLRVKSLVGNLQRVQEIAGDALRAFNATRLLLVHYEDVVDTRET
eukprot:SM002097S06540  [mRNA]  locus=s2097:132:1782:- [translate_table: standard]